jgi:hypothetical protein
MRKVKLSVSRAAKDVNRQVKYGKPEDGSLLVWLEAPAPELQVGAASLAVDEQPEGEGSL